MCDTKAHELSKQLRHLLAPHFLRRTKADVFSSNGGEEKGKQASEAPDQATSQEEKQKQALTTRMNDFIVWLRIGEAQERLYRSFLSSDQVRRVLATTTHVLEGLVVLKKLCDHPRLLTKKAIEAVDTELLASWYVPFFPQLWRSWGLTESPSSQRLASSQHGRERGRSRRQGQGLRAQEGRGIERRERQL